MLFATKAESFIGSGDDFVSQGLNTKSSLKVGQAEALLEKS